MLYAIKHNRTDYLKNREKMDSLNKESSFVFSTQNMLEGRGVKRQQASCYIPYVFIVV